MLTSYTVTTANDGLFDLLNFECIEDAIAYWKVGNVLPNDKGCWVDTFEIPIKGINEIEFWDDSYLEQPFDDTIPF